MAAQLTLDEFKVSKDGRNIAKILENPAILGSMEELSRNGKPAVLAVDLALPADTALDDTQKRHIGRWIRNILAERGWRPRKRLHFRSGRVFSSGAVYGRHTSPDTNMVMETVPTPFLPAMERVKRAQAMVRAFSSND